MKIKGVLAYQKQNVEKIIRSREVSHPSDLKANFERDYEP